MKEKLQEVLDYWEKDLLSNGEALDDMMSILAKGDADDVEMVRYFIEDTTEDGDDYLTDYQCLEVVVGTYELKWREQDD